MVDAGPGGLVGRLCRLAFPERLEADGDLLGRYCALRDEAAFAELVKRHGPMVFGVCRRVLQRSCDAEDACQATFLVLARKAGAIARPERLAGWLHGVAYRTALKARTAMMRRQTHERPMHALPDLPARSETPDLDNVLDDELERMPEKYRLPLLLCCIQGRTNEEAARLLGCPRGTVLSRLSRAREKLRGRLVRRGVTLSSVGLGAMLAETAVALPRPLADTLRAAEAVARSAPATLLADQVLRGMWLSKAKPVALAVVGALLLAAVGGVFVLNSHSAPASIEVKVEAAGADKEPLDKKQLPPEVRKAVASGLDFLARAQNADGSWTLRDQKDVAATSIAGLAFLAAGKAPGKGKFGAALSSALRFVLASEDARTPGLFSGATGTMYSEGFAVLFLAEAVQRMPESKMKQQVKEALTRGVELTLKAQNLAGGWRYRPIPADADLSVSGTVLNGLLAARLAGCKVPDEAIDKAARFLVSCQDAGGGFRYMPPGGPTSPSRTAQALAALRSCGPGQAAALKKGWQHLDGLGLMKVLGSVENLHYFYTHYQFAQTFWTSAEGEKWHAAASTDLLGRRSGDHWNDGTFGPHYATALALIVLQAPLENLSRFRR